MVERIGGGEGREESGAWKTIGSLSSKLLDWNTGVTFYQTRYMLENKDPWELGNLSLGYTNGQLKLYWTVRLGEKRIIDLDLEMMIKMIRQCIMTRSPFHPDVMIMLYYIVNQFMPGFHTILPYLGTHVFLKPYFEGLQVGFALSFYKRWNSIETLYNILGMPIPSTEELESMGDRFPLIFFFSRNAVEDVNIGRIRCGFFIVQRTNGHITSEFSIRFAFNTPFTGYLTQITQHLNPDGNDAKTVKRLNSLETKRLADTDVTANDVNDINNSDNSGESGSGSGSGSELGNGNESGGGGEEANNYSTQDNIDNTTMNKQSEQDKTIGEKEIEGNDDDNDNIDVDVDVNKEEGREEEEEEKIKHYININHPSSNKWWTSISNYNNKEEDQIPSIAHSIKDWNIKWKLLPFSLAGLAISLGGFYKLPNPNSIPAMI